jgi:hypothetical protein
MGFLQNTVISLVESRQQALLRIRVRKSRVDVADRLNRNSTRVLTAFCAAHTIGHNGQSTESLELGFILRLPVSVIVLVVFPMAPNIGEAGDLDPRTNFHSPPGSEREELYATASRLTFVTLTFVIFAW